jgi:hypothetical protein
MWGVVYQGYNAVFPSFYPETVPDPHPRLGNGDLAESRHLVTALLPALFVDGGAARRPVNIPMTIGSGSRSRSPSSWRSPPTAPARPIDPPERSRQPAMRCRPEQEYARLREQTLADARMAKA